MPEQRGHHQARCGGKKGERRRWRRRLAIRWWSRIGRSPGPLCPALAYLFLIATPNGQCRTSFVEFQEEYIVSLLYCALLCQSISELEQSIAHERQRCAQRVKLIVFAGRIGLLCPTQNSFKSCPVPRALLQRRTGLGRSLVSLRGELLLVRRRVIAMDDLRMDDVQQEQR